MIRDLSTLDDEVISTDPVETVRMFARLRATTENMDPVDIIGQAGKDTDGRLKQAVLTLPGLVAMADEIERLRADVARLQRNVAARDAPAAIGGTSTCFHVRTRKGGLYGVGASGKTDARTLVARRLAEAGEDDSPTTAERIGQWPAAYGTVLHYGDA